MDNTRGGTIAHDVPWTPNDGGGDGMKRDDVDGEKSVEIKLTGKLPTRRLLSPANNDNETRFRQPSRPRIFFVALTIC